jgi:Secretion system C-terminal sorting domain
MKILYALLLVMICGRNAFAQNQGSVWVSGKKGEIDFSTGQAIAKKRSDKKEICSTSASICDKNGNLLFYTNGFRAFNRFGNILLNGDSLDMGDYTYWGYGFNSNPDGAVILPFPGDSEKYYLFYTDLNNIATELGGGLWPTHIYYAIVDMTLDGGLGGIDSSNKKFTLLTDTLTQCSLQAVKHSDGRDWWLVTHEYGSNRYYKFLITPAGIQGPFNQEIGGVFKLQNAQIASPMKFTLDGSRFFHASFDSNRIELFDFDRCTGNLSNLHTFKADTSLVYVYGASFSPSGRYIYLSINENEIRQYDIYASDITGSSKTVGVSDNKGDPFQPNFYLHQLGPDRKVYITAYDDDFALHIINDPDSAGKACHFIEWGFKLKYGSTWFSCAPNEPNYNLGMFDSCDVVITDLPPIIKSAFTHGIYPNPCTGKFQLSITGVISKTEIAIYNTMGERIEQSTLQPVNGFIHDFFNLQNEPAGVYLLKAHTNRGDFTEKILKE